MRLRENESAIDFSCEDIYGNPIKLSDYQDRRLLLSFYRYASCPFCNLRVNQLIKKCDDFQNKGLKVLAFFESPNSSILKYIGKQKPPFPIVGDPERLVYKLYGIESSVFGLLKAMTIKLSKFIQAIRSGYLPGKMETDLFLLPADFLIGPDQKIHKAYYGNDIGDHLPITEIESWLNE